MTTIRRTQKPLTVEPLKAGQPVGAALAFLGMDAAVPLLHGSQGCTAFTKVFFTRHFREPIPLQTTAVEQISAVMGAEGNIIEALATIAKKASPSLVGLISTGLTEAEGCDLTQALKVFRTQHPELDAMQVVPVHAPDFTGALESGFAHAVTAIIHQLVPASGWPGSQPQVNILAGALLTPGDLETLEAIVEAFGLLPITLPNLSLSMDGALGDSEFTPHSVGGTTLEELAQMGHSRATLAIGASMREAGALLEAKTGVPTHNFDTLVGLHANDQLLLLLSQISGRPIPRCYTRQRRQLQDALLDTHFLLTHLPVGVAGEPDFLLGCCTLLHEVGARPVAILSSYNAQALNTLPVTEVLVGDLEDLELLSKQNGAQLLIGNSHVAQLAARLDLPVLRGGYPVYDWLGAFRRTWIGYGGARDTLFELANLVVSAAHQEVAPYRSCYAPTPAPEFDHGHHGAFHNGH